MPFKGFRHTEETRAKMSETRKGKYMGELNPMYGKIISAETRAKLREAGKGNKNALGCRHSLEIRTRNSEAHKGYRQTEEHRANSSEAQKGKTMSVEARAKMSKSIKEHWQDPEYRAKISIALKEVWQDLEYRNKTQKILQLARQIHPNKPETALLALLTSIAPDEWAFVGDGQLIIAGKNPDFANINGKKQLIELFGDYWHQGENPEERIALFRQYGYDTLIVWERELKKPNEVLSKVVEFTARIRNLSAGEKAHI